MDIMGNLRIIGTSIEMGAFENINVVTNISVNSRGTESSGVFPNPGHSSLTVFTDNRNSRFQLFDGSGYLVLEQTITGNELSFDVESLKAGIYFYRIIFEAGVITVKTGKWIKVS